MLHEDPLYGSWQLPESIERLIPTDRAQRMLDISLSVLPLMFEPFGPMPSRFQHGMGVARLATEVLASNITLTERCSLLLPVAAFLHDAGSPPFSHLSEPFLQTDLGMDGETFLTAMLQGSQTGKVIEDLGLDIDEVVGLVTGRDKPIAEVLHGSVDIDNVDNVARYWLSGTGRPSAGYDPLVMASSYRFDPVQGSWSLLDSCYEQAQGWKRCRASAYGLIYSHPHWAAAAMVQRALYLHWSLDRHLGKDFYFLNDGQAAQLLLASRSLPAREVMAQAANHAWYVPVVAMVSEGDVPVRVRDFSKNPLQRHLLANDIASRLGIPQHHVCTNVGVGRDRRKITMPFRDAGGTLTRLDEGPTKPVWRVYVWVHPDDIDCSAQILRIIRDEVL